ncbi:LPXTG cell wall anchor domain-containing protein [Boudabousia marimammalium]|uniref:LPXTG cell wall anchor domain-containing protein n=1 Tax=Boudabousia marimammalium TaxID=156892 RepID=UPI0013013269|nr:LPXTG cell wall anchor domain-containing protein [Boudabousia marimammalium]
MNRFHEKILMALVLLLAALPVVLAVILFARLGQYWLLAILVGVALLALLAWWLRRRKEKKLGLGKFKTM